MRRVPAVLAAASMRSASRRSAVIGFSTSTCKPRLDAATARSAEVNAAIAGWIATRVPGAWPRPFIPAMSGE